VQACGEKPPPAFASDWLQALAFVSKHDERENFTYPTTTGKVLPLRTTKLATKKRNQENKKKKDDSIIYHKEENTVPC